MCRCLAPLSPHTAPSQGSGVPGINTGRNVIGPQLIPQIMYILALKEE